SKIKEIEIKNKIIITFDIESTQNSFTLINSESLIHRAMLLISNTVCDKCWNTETNEKIIENCENCGIFYHEFFGYDCCKKFIKYLITLSEKTYKNKIKI